MRDLEFTTASLRGSLLIAHPGLLDPHFRKSVVLLSEHSAEDGAIGVILNRPMQKTLGQIKEGYEDSDLYAVPAFEGGPVRTDEVLLTAWRWDNEAGTFQLYFGLPPEAALDLRRSDPEFEIRAYLGYAGWSEGQIEGELGESAWIVSPIAEEYLELEHLDGLWRKLLQALKPELSFLADAPDDPMLN